MRSWQGYQKGVNLGGWFSQCEYSKERFDSFITEADIERLSHWGIDHLRLPVDYNLVETEDGEYKEEGFAYIKRAIEWCRKYGLNMILDLHKTMGYSFDPGESQAGFFDNEVYQERFYRLWEQFATRFSGYGDNIAFELLNEVVDKSVCDAWNRISTVCIKRIRNIAPDTKILLGGYWNNSVKAVKDLAMPFDENIVYNFHCYDPLLFTHQGAYWVEGMPLDFRMGFDCTMQELKAQAAANLPEYQANLIQADPYDGELDENYFEDLFAEAIVAAEQRNVSLYCGEYGVIDKATPEDTLAWYSAIHTVFERHGIGRAAWSYKEMDFGLQEERLSGVLEQLTKLL